MIWGRELVLEEILSEQKQGHTHQTESYATVLIGGALHKPGRFQMLGPAQTHAIRPPTGAKDCYPYDQKH